MAKNTHTSDDAVTAVCDLGVGRRSQWTAAAVTVQRLSFPVLRVFTVKVSA